MLKRSETQTALESVEIEQVLGLKVDLHGVSSGIGHEARRSQT